MNKQEFYRKEYHRLNPDWQDSLTIYRDTIDQFTHTGTKLLDIGCGHGQFLKPVYDKTIHTYGVDPDQAALDKNTLIKNKVVGFVEKLPFENNFFDLVISEWVLEHLDNPKQAFSEIYRVLKPGGKVVFLTPNVWNYNVWIIRLIPNRLHSFFTKKLYQRQEGDTYPVRYKINSLNKLTKTLTPIGFKKIKVILNGDPSYISFNKPLFVLACLIEKILNIKALHFAKVHLIGIYQK